MDELRAPLTTRLRTPALVVVDVVIALLLAMPALIRSLDPARGTGPGEVLGVLAALPVAVRRIWPVRVFGVVLVASVAATIATGFEGFVSDPFFAVAFVSYPVALNLNERRAAVVAGITLVVIVTTAAVLPSDIRASRSALALVGVCLTVASWALGLAVRQHRRYEAMRRTRATDEAALRERLRVAREVHDLLAHGMSVIAVQAGVANHVIDSNPSEARRVLASIAGTSRAGLAELRGLMSTLRSTEAPEPAALQPAPGIDGLPELLDRIEATGVRADLVVRGEQRPVPPGIDLAVYRIVQESLTNVVRHAGAKRCGVEVVYLPDTLTVEIVDDGHGGTFGGNGSGDGHGLAGMRERVAIYGGALDVGPVPEPGRGFRVAARLPLRDGGAG
jgi:signal transduction histidine kinase